MKSRTPLNSGVPSSGSADFVQYREVQHFRQVWIWVVVVGITLAIWYTFIMQIVLGIPLGSNPAPDKLVIIFWILFGILFPLFSMTARLITEVRSDGIYLRFMPFHLTFRRIPFLDITRCWVRDYRPIMEFGGWGIRKTARGMARAYTVSGKRGLQLFLMNGQMILIGSQTADDLYQAVIPYIPEEPEDEEEEE